MKRRRSETVGPANGGVSAGTAVDAVTEDGSALGSDAVQAGGGNVISNRSAGSFTVEARRNTGN